MRFAHAAQRASIIALCCMTGAAWSADNPPCAPATGFRDTPHPAIASPEQLVSHTEEIFVDRPIAVVSDVMNKPLNQAIHKSSSLPGVAGDFVLTPGKFGAPGTRRIVCLTDGGSVEEEVLKRDGTATSGIFKYIVWNYATPKGRPIAYGVGEFRTVQTDNAHTRVTWTYSFKLKDDVFPGSFGALGRWLFRVRFLDRDYAAMMRTTLSGTKTDAEARPIDPRPQQ
jgi:hypothetical protein